MFISNIIDVWTGARALLRSKARASKHCNCVSKYFYTTLLGNNWQGLVNILYVIFFLIFYNGSIVILFYCIPIWLYC